MPTDELSEVPVGLRVRSQLLGLLTADYDLPELLSVVRIHPGYSLSTELQRAAGADVRVPIHSCKWSVQMSTCKQGWSVCCGLRSERGPIRLWRLRVLLTTYI